MHHSIWKSGGMFIAVCLMILVPSFTGTAEEQPKESPEALVMNQACLGSENEASGTGCGSIPPWGVVVPVGECGDTVFSRTLIGFWQTDCMSPGDCVFGESMKLNAIGDYNRLCISDTVACTNYSSMVVTIVGDNNEICSGGTKVCGGNTFTSMTVIGDNNKVCNVYVEQNTYNIARWQGGQL